MIDYHIAQINIAEMLAPADDPIMADFFANIDRINAIADKAEGFVWRLQSDSGNATDIRVFDETKLIVNMSVWESIDALFNYTYKSDHVDIFRRRKEWFSKLGTHHLVMWWIPAGTIPTTEEAKVRLNHIDEHGPTPYAFTFKPRFTIEEMLAMETK